MSLKCTPGMLMVFLTGAITYVLSQDGGRGGHQLRRGCRTVCLFQVVSKVTFFFDLKIRCLMALVVRTVPSWPLRIVLGSGDFLSEVGGFLLLGLPLVLGVRRGRIFREP